MIFSQSLMRLLRWVFEIKHGHEQLYTYNAMLYNYVFLPTFLFCTPLFPCVCATCSQLLSNSNLKYTLIQQHLILTFIKIINSLFRDIIVIGLKFSETAIIVSQVSCCFHFKIWKFLKFKFVCVAGLPSLDPNDKDNHISNPNHAKNSVDMGLEMIDLIREVREDFGVPGLDMR